MSNTTNKPTAYSADLAAWMNQEGISQTELARRMTTNVSQPTASRWVAGLRWPTPEQQDEIERLSNGQVPARCSECSRVHRRPISPAGGDRGAN